MDAEAHKACSRCKAEKSFTDFYFKKGKPDSWCRDCTLESQRAYGQRADGREERKRRNAERYAKTMSRPDTAENRRLKARSAAALRRYHRPDVRAAEAERMRLWRLDKPWEALIRAAKSRSVKKGLQFSLSVEWGKDRYTGKCELTGLAFVPGDSVQNPRSPSLDRIESGKGYTEENCRFVISAVNSLKSSGSDDEMYLIAQALISHRESF